MAINWANFENEITDFLISKNSTDIEETAQFFTDTYIESIRTGRDPAGNIVLVDSKNPDIIKQGWIKALTACLKSPVNLGAVPWVFVSEALIEYWTLMPATFLMPYAPAVTGTLNGIVFPGNVVSVTPGIHNALNAGNETKVASELTETFRNHTKSLGGTFVGLTASTPPAPVVKPWKGIR